MAFHCMVVPHYGLVPWLSAAQGEYVLRNSMTGSLWLLSPELTPDTSKDYSVYVLDPLEDFISKEYHNQSMAPSSGVAVGMGLLSDILCSSHSDSVMVNGTLVQCSEKEHALEVVLSLRCVKSNIFMS